MEISEIIKKSNLEQAEIFYNEPMSKHTSFKIGGLAECYVKINKLPDLQEIINISNRY